MKRAARRNTKRGNGSDAVTTTPPAAAAIFPAYMGPKLAARYIDVSVRTLADWRLHNTGPKFYRIGDGPRAPIRYARDDLDVWMRRNVCHTTAHQAAHA